MNIKDFQVGDQVMYGRFKGEQTLGEVIKVNRTRLKVRQLEARGTLRNYPVGTIWTVPPTLCTKVNPSAPAKRRREDTILRDAQQIILNLEPEVLFCDGERDFADATRAARALRKEFRGLERELGRPITEFGDIEGHMPVSLSRASFAPAKRSDLHKGDKVTFRDKQGRPVTGYVTRVNQKTISVQPVGGGSRYWRVSPHLLTKVA